MFPLDRQRPQLGHALRIHPGIIVNEPSHLSLEGLEPGLHQLVSETEADLKSGKISVKSPIAQGLLGKSVGERAEIAVPAGKMEFEILEISR